MQCQKSNAKIRNLTSKKSMAGEKKNTRLHRDFKKTSKGSDKGPRIQWRVVAESQWPDVVDELLCGEREISCFVSNKNRRESILFNFGNL